MNLQQQLVELDNLVVQGKFLEAIEQFFHDDVICYSKPDDAIYGKTAKHDATQNFFGNLAAINHIALHSQAVGNDVTMSEMAFEFSMQNGKRLVWNEIIRRTWKEGKVIEEKYYTCECGETDRENTEPHPASLYDIQHPDTAGIDVKEEVTTAPQLEGHNFSGSATSLAATIDDLVEGQDINIDSIGNIGAIEPIETSFTSSFTSFIGTPAEEDSKPQEETTLESGFNSASFFVTPPEEAAEMSGVKTEIDDIQSLFTQGEMTSDIAEDESKEDMSSFTTTLFGTSFDESENASSIASSSLEAITPIENEENESGERVLSGDKVILKGMAVNQEIPDDFATPLVSAMTFTNEGTVSKVGLNVNIEHPFIQDLIVKLVAPSGKSVIVHNRDGIVNNSIKNIQRAYDPEHFDAFKGESIAGDWKLEVSDNSKRDTGKLNGWSLYLLPEETTTSINEPATEAALETETNTNAGFMFFGSQESSAVEVSETELLESKTTTSIFLSSSSSSEENTENTVEEEATPTPNLGTTFESAGFMSFYNEQLTEGSEPEVTSASFEVEVSEQNTSTPFIDTEEQEANAFAISTAAPNLSSSSASSEDTTTAYQRLSGSRVLSQIVLVNEVIPDNYGALVSRMRFSTPRPVEQMDLEIDIDHPCISDLVISLIAPSGKSVTVHNRAGGRAEHLKKVYENSKFELFKGESVAGDWKLEVFDKATTDVGKLNHWSLRILPGDQETDSTEITDTSTETIVTETKETSISNIAPSALAASVAGGVTKIASEDTSDTMTESFMQGVEEVREDEIIAPAKESNTASMEANVQITELQVNELIPDDQNTPLVSSIHLVNNGIVKDLGLFVDIEHPFCTDLQIILESPSGKSAVVYDREGGFSTNMIHYFNSEFFPGLIDEPIQGEWRLKIYDFAPQDEGKLNAWRLYVLPA